MSIITHPMLPSPLEGEALVPAEFAHSAMSNGGLRHDRLAELMGWEFAKGRVKSDRHRQDQAAASNLDKSVDYGIPRYLRPSRCSASWSATMCGGNPFALLCSKISVSV